MRWAVGSGVRVDFYFLSRYMRPEGAAAMRQQTVAIYIIFPLFPSPTGIHSRSRRIQPFSLLILPIPPGERWSVGVCREQSNAA